MLLLLNTELMKTPQQIFGDLTEYDDIFILLYYLLS